MLDTLKLDIASAIASGIVLGRGILSMPSYLEQIVEVEGNWKVISSIILVIILYVGVPAGAALGWFKWVWLIPACIAGTVCQMVSEYLCEKEQEEKKA